MLYNWCFHGLLHFKIVHIHAVKYIESVFEDLILPLRCLQDRAAKTAIWAEKITEIFKFYETKEGSGIERNLLLDILSVLGFNPTDELITELSVMLQEKAQTHEENNDLAVMHLQDVLEVLPKFLAEAKVRRAPHKVSISPEATFPLT